MRSEIKIFLSVVFLIAGIWLLLPEIPIIKPASSLMSFDLVWWPYLIQIIQGTIPIGLFLLGSLLLWIEYDEYKTEKTLETEEEPEESEREETRDIEEEEMPSFEDVEYKDLECPECGEDFKTEIGLKVHRKVNHPEEYKKNPEPFSEEE